MTRLFEEFHGLTLVTTDGVDGVCLQIVRTADITPGSDQINGQVDIGCGVGVFAPTVNVAVTEQSPAAIRKLFPDGTALNFTFDDPQVEVRSG